MTDLEFEVELTRDDLIQFQIDHTMNNKAFKKFTYLFIILGVIFLSISVFLIYMGFFDPLIIAVFLSIGSVCTIYPFFRKRYLRSFTKKFIPEGTVDSQIGKTIYEFDDEHVSRQSEDRYERIKWKLIIGQLETDDHIYLYDSSISAYIFPKRELSPEDLLELKRTIEERRIKKLFDRS